MVREKSKKIKFKILPYIIAPAVLGVLCGVLIFLFKIASGDVINRSRGLYEFVRSDPRYLPLLVVGFALVGGVSALILKYAKQCRGGGIPTAIASIRGLVPLRWVQGIFGLFFSSLLTYLAGVPLGNEGPSVQMGTALGKGASETLGDNRRESERYLMTGGACSGFAVATGAPLSGIMFAIEEAHRRFTPIIFIVSAIAVLTGCVTQELLSTFFNVDTTFFHLTINEILPLSSIWIPAVIGVACGLISVIVTQAYRVIKNITKKLPSKIPFELKIIFIFVITALLGFACEDFVGSGHSLVEKIIEGNAVWYLLAIALIVRVFLMICANNGGVSGGIFIPTLTYGAIISALVVKLVAFLGLVDSQYYAILIVVGMASYLAASARTPITALAFALEALCVAHNIIPVVVGVGVSYLVAEMSGNESYTDAVIESRVEAAHKGKTPIIVDAHMTVQPNAFAIGMELRDILWPPSCVVLSVDKANTDLSQSFVKLREGDTLHLHYQTYDQEETMEHFTHILGKQPGEIEMKTHTGKDAHIVPLE